MLDGQLVTWDGSLAQNDHPPGRFAGFDSQDTAGHYIGVRPGGPTQRWGWCGVGCEPGCPQIDEYFVDVSASHTYGAGLRPDGTVRLWGCPWNNVGHIDGQGPYRRVECAGWGGPTHVIGLRPDWRLDIFGSELGDYLAAPRTRYRSVDAGAQHSLGITWDGHLVAWGQPDFGNLDVPSGTYVTATTGAAVSAALRADGTLTCWGAFGGNCDQVDGRFVHIAAGQDHLIALRCTEPRSFHYSPELGAIGWQQPRTHLFEGVPTSATGPVRLSVIARADLAAANDFLILRGDGSILGTVFATTGTHCAEWWDVQVLEIPAATYNALAADGALSITVEGSIGVQPAACGAEGSLQLILDVPQPEVDCDADGFLDHCQIMLNPELDCDGDGALDSCASSVPKDDCDANGVSDACEIEKHPYLDCTGLGILDACAVAQGLVPDCNGNGVPDSCDILDGASLDKNANVVPDECEYAYGDFNLDGQIDGADLAMILSLWGLKDPPLGDLTNDGVIGGGDLAVLLGRWGEVPF